jgi:carbamoyl-phosphate synthase small subunit
MTQKATATTAREAIHDALRWTPAQLVLADGTTFRGRSFGHPGSVAGEVVFTTGMVGYPETLTDPSYRGQILTFTYPLVGNYGVPAEDPPGELSTHFESDRIHAAGLLVADYSPEYSHWHASRSLADWLVDQKIPALTGIDTRTLTQKLRVDGSMLGKIEFPDHPVDFHDPNQKNLVADVSIDAPALYGRGKGRKRVVVYDTGAKFNIIHCLMARGLEVLRVPFDYPLADEAFDGLMLSNGPGDPRMAEATVEQIRWAIGQTRPIFGICLGNQLLARAIGAETYKMKFGHRGQNQPVIECGTSRCFVTSQNHGFAVDAASIPTDWREWFVNLNDGSNEGLRHAWAPFRSVQFHPEANPGPTDTAFLFDEFARMISP